MTRDKRQVAVLASQHLDLTSHGSPSRRKHLHREHTWESFITSVRPTSMPLMYATMNGSDSLRRSIRGSCVQLSRSSTFEWQSEFIPSASSAMEVPPPVTGTEFKLRLAMVSIGNSVICCLAYPYQPYPNSHLRKPFL